LQADKEGQYDVMGDKQEYILTKDDVNSDYSDNNIKQSFTVKTMNKKIFNKFNPL
jgi:hypothetical protein